MKHEHLRKLTNIAAVIASVAAVIFSSFYTKVESSMTPMLLGLVASAYAAIFSIALSRMKEKRFHQRRIFIMYSHVDIEIASKLVLELREAGYNPWFDRDEIAPGQRISDTLESGISQSAVAVLLVSKNIDLEKGAIGKELKIALSTMKSRDESFSPVIPIRLDDTSVPESLSGIHWLHIQDKDFFLRLDKGLKRILGT